MSERRRRRRQQSKSIDWQAQSRTISFRIGPLKVEPPEGNHAGFWLRALARLADDIWVGIVAGTIAFVATFVLDAWLDLGGHVLTVLTVLTTVVHLIYFTIWTAINGQSWGKALAGIKVVDAKGEVPSWAVSFWRALADGLFIFLQNFVIGIIDPLVVPFHKQRRSIHDLMCGTRVVRVAPVRKRALAIAAVVCLGGEIGLVFGLILPFVAHSYYVPSESMVPTLRVNDRLMANRLAYRVRAPRRDEIIMFVAPEGAPKPGEAYVKRLIGVSGDMIAVRDGKLFRNGKWVDEPYAEANDEFPSAWYGEDEEAIWGELVTDDGIDCVRVPKGHLFVMGDNRNNSSDSRVWGYVSTDALIGRALFRFWPLHRMGKL